MLSTTKRHTQSQKTGFTFEESLSDGQSVIRLSRPTLSTFSTPLGWMGILGVGEDLVSAFVGHCSSSSIRATLGKTTPSVDVGDWNPHLRVLFERYAAGEEVDFSRVSLLFPEMTPFRRQIVAATCRLGYGMTASYGDIARIAGRPGAARAVGTAMSCNRFPIIVPCHRVLAAGGKLGGYTAPAGTTLKQKLLDMEARSVAAGH